MGVRKSASRSPGNGRFDFESLVASAPNRSESLRTLHHLFQQRAFLPELKDVRRFLDRHLGDPQQPRSRDGARRVVFEFLATMSDEGFQRIHEEALIRASGKGDLEIVADAILNRRDD